MITKEVWIAVAIMAVVTAALRFIPFFVFGGNKKTPKIVEKFGRILPYAVMGMLVVYCIYGLEGVSAIKEMPQFDIIGILRHVAPIVISGGITAGLYIWKRNTLLGIISGTVSYMILVQFVF